MVYKHCREHSEISDSFGIVVAFRKAGWFESSESDLSSLATDSPGQLDVLGHDGYTLGMNGTQVGVLKQSNEVGLTSLLKSSNS